MFNRNVFTSDLSTRVALSNDILLDDTLPCRKKKYKYKNLMKNFFKIINIVF